MKTMKKQGGVIMLENMIAILIFSFGILGIVGLLAASMKTSASAKYRSDASMLANRIVSEMWVDDKTNTALKTNFESPSGSKYVAWKSTVESSLPGVADNLPTVTIDASNVATVTVRWKSPGEAAPHNFVLIARING